MISNVLIPILIVLTLVAINGIFVAAEFALVASRPSRLKTLADQGNRSARWLVGVFERPLGKDGYIAIAQLGITLASIGLGMYGEPAVAGWLYQPFEDLGLSNAAAHTVGFIVALSGITYLHVVLGEMIPKALALQSPEAVILRVNPAMRVFGLMFRPMVFVLNATALGLMRLLRIPEPDKRLGLYTSAELAIVTDESASSGQLADLQRNLIHNVFEFEERTVEELMTSRSRITSIDIDTSPDEITELIARSTLSRYPVTDGSLDRVVGVLHIKDFIRAQQRGASVVLPRLVRSMPTLASTASAEQALEMFRSDRTHAALIVDEHGGTLGLITMDDLIAEVMDDETDTGDSPAVHHEDGSLSLDGEVTLAELEHDHGIEIDHAEVTTIAGVVLASTAILPSQGTTVTVNGHEFTVEEVLGRKITRIRVRRPQQPTDANLDGASAGHETHAVDGG